uniref:Ig-like domain-containing protein n=1 Tax=Oncorhynchus tshawytscha TaxID=74940 RepID=A0AAZ3NWB0_ONCTS
HPRPGVLILRPLLLLPVTTQRILRPGRGTITFPCRYDQYYINHVKYWCKGLGWDVCLYVVRTDHPKSSGKTSISDDINKRIFTVTITDLVSRDSNTYRCVVEINRGTDIMIQRFYLSVTPGKIPSLLINHILYDQYDSLCFIHWYHLELIVI